MIPRVRKPGAGGWTSGQARPPDRQQPHPGSGIAGAVAVAPAEVDRTEVKFQISVFEVAFSSSSSTLS
jgi:hypothetical protein